MRLFGTLVRLAIVLVVVYALLSGAIGFIVGRKIYEAKSGNPLVEVGSLIVGQENTERIALRQAKLPRIVTESPAFWIALRASE